jgi:hypothetical protein
LTCNSFAASFWGATLVVRPTRGNYEETKNVEKRTS